MTQIRIFAIVCLLGLASLVWRSDAPAQVGPCDCCNSSVSGASGVLFACPQGDGETLASLGLTISLTLRNCNNEPVQGVPASDISLIGCNDILSLCGGAGGAIGATAPTDANGQTTIEGAFAAGGCDNGVRVIVQGCVLGAGTCGEDCVPVDVRSCDIDGDLQVDLADFALFGAGYTSPPKAYNECLDFAPSGTVDLNDFAKYGAHDDHEC